MSFVYYILCVFSTQFISRQQSELTVNLVQSASVGQKDAQMSLFSLWKAIFQLPSAKRCAFLLSVDTLTNVVLYKHITAHWLAFAPPECLTLTSVLVLLDYNYMFVMYCSTDDQ